MPDDPREAGLFHNAFLMPNRAALADWLGDAVERRTPLDGASDHLVSEAIYLSDPEGNGVEMCTDRPREEWRWRDGRVEMATNALDARSLLAARSAGGWRGAPAGTRVGHVHLRVGDVAKAKEFYAGDLGMDVVCARPGAAFLSWNGYHHHVAVNTWQSAGAASRDPRRAGLRHVAFAGLPRVSPLLAVLDRDPWGTTINNYAR